MPGDSEIPVTKPTDLERQIWKHVQPRLVGGVIRQGTAGVPYKLPDCFYGPRDKTNPEHWDCKMKGGPDAEWWVYVMQGAKRIIDVGCGYGFPAFYLAKNGFEVVGVDPSPSEIATAEEYRLREGPDLPLKYVVIEPNVLPFEDDSYDGATLSGSLASSCSPEKLMSEVKRVLKPGSIVAIDEEDRALEPKRHPVAEYAKIVEADDDYYLWIESRTCEPYLDRRYMIKLSRDFQPKGKLEEQKAAGAYMSAATLDEVHVTIEEVLSFAVEGQYGEATGYDAAGLKKFVERMGFTDLKFWARNNGKRFAEILQETGVLGEMPDDITAVLRALAISIPPLGSPTTLITCVFP